MAASCGIPVLQHLTLVDNRLTKSNTPCRKPSVRLIVIYHGALVAVGPQFVTETECLMSVKKYDHIVGHVYYAPY